MSKFLCLLLLLAGCVEEKRPLADAYHVNPQTCYECHEEATQNWRGSHHDLAMQEATEQTVLGDFDNASLGSYRFTYKDGRYFVNEHEVKYAFGVEPLQQYLLALPGGRLQATTVCWDTERKVWFYLYGEELPTGDELHWQGALQNWNYMCAECHSTNLQKGYDLATDSYQTTWDEINVGCQACHGPGSVHNARAADEDNANPKGFANGVEIDTCARCHSRRRIVSDDYEHGKPFTEHYAPSLLIDRLYHADGQILEEVYVYGSYVQSRMHAAGVKCTHCHEPHTTKLRLEGNLMCARCHKEEPPEEYEGLESKDYDRKEHHFHEPGTLGSMCVDCHAPSKNYMQVDPRHDHSFRVPRPDLTIKIGTPNACNGCHKDQTPEWSVKWIDKWYSEPARPAHYGEVFAAARANKPEAADGLIALAADMEQPAIVRATAVFELRRFGPVVVGLDDPEPLVRGAAVGGADPEDVKPLLKDESRWVRTEAARIAPEDGPALDEFFARENAVADRPGAHLNLGVAHTALGKPKLAEKAYRTALRLDPAFVPARFNLANLLNAQGRNRDAERELNEVLKLQPDNGEAHYSLALLLAEMQRIEEAEPHLNEAAQRLPGRARVRYNHALALQQLKRYEDAELRFKEAVKLAPYDPDIRHALVMLYVQARRWKEALPHARELAELEPKARRLLQQIEQAARN